MIAASTAASRWPGSEVQTGLAGFDGGSAQGCIDRNGTASRRGPRPRARVAPRSALDQLASPPARRGACQHSPQVELSQVSPLALCGGQLSGLFFSAESTMLPAAIEPGICIDSASASSSASAALAPASPMISATRSCRLSGLASLASGMRWGSTKLAACARSSQAGSCEPRQAHSARAARTNDSSAL